MLHRPQWTALVIVAAISLAATNNATASPQCPNLSGDYIIQGEDGQVNIAIQQHECDRINIVRKSNYFGRITSEKHMLKLDGKDQQDSPWLGGADSTRLRRSLLARNYGKSKNHKSSDPHNLYSLTPARDLLEATVTDHQRVPVLAKREK